jgi:Zn-finger nucleic acid-binding protein
MCPVCDEPLVSYWFEGVEIDRCLECGGTWLDAGELELLVELAGYDPREIGARLRAARRLRRGERRCPRCPRRLDVIEIGDDERIEIDRCPIEHGLWLDRDEMEAVIATSTEADAGAVAKYFAELYRSDLQTSIKGE